MTRNKAPRKRFAPIAALVATFALLFSALGILTAPAQAAGNSGTIKIHAQGSPSGTESNEPHVCAFNIEAFGFDKGFDGYIEFAVQGGDGPTGVAAGPFAVGPADAAGYFATNYFNVVGGATIQNGHYMVTLYGKFNGRINYEDVKAKSKVFKVDCPPPPPTPASPAVVTSTDVCEPTTGPTNDRIVIPTDANFTYQVDGTAAPAGPFVATGTTHTVTAVPKAGVVVAPGATTQWTLTFTKVLCVTPVSPPPPPAPATPAAVTKTDVCEPATGPTNDRIMIPTDASFTYKVDGIDRAAGPFVATGTTHTVTAVAKAGVVVAQGATTQWTFTFTKVLCVEVLGASATRVKGAVKKIDKCGRAGDVFSAKRVKGVTYLVKGRAIREGVWLKARTRTVKVRAVASSDRYKVVGQDVWVLRFTNKPCAVAPTQLPATGA